MECYMFVILTVTFNSKKLFLHLGKKIWPGNEGKDTFWLDQVLTPFLHIPVRHQIKSNKFPRKPSSLQKKKRFSNFLELPLSILAYKEMTRKATYDV